MFRLQKSLTKAVRTATTIATLLNETLFIIEQNGSYFLSMKKEAGCLTIKLGR